MKRINTDILISGGGLAGLIATCVFANAGFDVICVDPNPSLTQSDNPKADLRSTALLQPARNLLCDAGIWSHIEPHGAALQTMRIIDAGGVENEIRVIADFNANDISNEPFGWNFPNWLLHRELLARLNQLPNAQLINSTSVSSLITRDQEALVSLDNKCQISARIVIGADGRNSFIRQTLNIDVKTWRYAQKALVFNVEHDKSHNNTSIEIHRSGGPFTLVPMPDSDTKYKSSVVWMETSENAQHLMQMNKSDFNTALNSRSCAILGALTLTSHRMIWPIISQQAKCLIAQRTALIAEAAHVLPPIGAQGLNISIADIKALVTLFQNDPQNIGSTKMLNAYAKARMGDISRRMKVIDALNRASISNNNNLKALRFKGLQILHGFSPLRKSLMKAGLGSVET